MRLFIYPYKPASKSARELARAVGIKRLKHEGSRYKPRITDSVVNWGSSKLPPALDNVALLNVPQAVAVASNKLSAFNEMEGKVSVPPFSNLREEATEWLTEGAVICRKTLQGSGGDGIVVAENEEDMVNAPLYTKYIKKQSEWRVHIFRGEVLMIQRKVRNFDVPDDQVKWKIRNHANGFVFQQHGINPPVCVVEEATKAITVLKLDFGAVDVIYNEHQAKAYVLEVNCAPGLEGTTLERYTQALNKIGKVA